jgi:hypothetical protein
MNRLESKSRFLISQPNQSPEKSSSKTDEQSAGHVLKRMLIAAALLSVCFSTSNADARHRYYAAPTPPQVGCSDPVMHPCTGMDVIATRQNGVKAGRTRSQSLVQPPSFEFDRQSAPEAAGQVPRSQGWRQVGENSVVRSRTARSVRSRSQEPKATRIGPIVSPLAAKVREISSSCGSSVVSGVRHTHIANTRTMSLHASGQAVDMKGNPRCIYQHLAAWPGGYSTDYGRMQHVHISYSRGGREWGLRFAHGGRHRLSYARLQHHR